MTAAIPIAIVVAVLLGGVAFMTLARRSDVRGAGALSGETRRRDEEARGQRDDTAERETALVATASSAAPASTAVARTSQEAERRGEIARYGAVEKAPPPPEITPWVPPDPEAIGVSRRQFFNRASVSLMATGIGAFSAAGFVAFLWPTATGGFGSKVPVGKLGDIRTGIASGDGFYYLPQARTWITEYPADAVAKGKEAYDEVLWPAMDAGIMALYQKCPHLGCRVPECASSQWFECGCHGSQYNRVGEKKAGPAPRGMDRFPVEIAGEEVTIDTGTVILGPEIGVNTTGQEAEGPHCVSGGEH